MQVCTPVIACALVIAMSPVQKPPAAGANPISQAIKQAWDDAKGNLQASADQMPDADYAFKPVDSVRTFGQILAHVAGANYVFCSAAKGEKFFGARRSAPAARRRRPAPRRRGSRRAASVGGAAACTLLTASLLARTCRAGSSGDRSGGRGAWRSAARSPGWRRRSPRRRWRAGSPPCARRACAAASGWSRL